MILSIEPDTISCSAAAYTKFQSSPRGVDPITKPDRTGKAVAMRKDQAAIVSMSCRPASKPLLFSRLLNASTPASVCVRTSLRPWLRRRASAICSVFPQPAGAITLPRVQPNILSISSCSLTINPRTQRRDTGCILAF